LSKLELRVAAMSENACARESLARKISRRRPDAQSNSEIVEAVWWNGGDKSLPVGKFDLAFAPSVNEFNGRRTVQLKVLDWRAAE
jgi:hypothetical protein